MTAAILAWVDRHRVALLAACVVLYLAGFSAQWRIAPDSVSHLQSAENLVRGLPLVTDANPIALSNNPGLAWLIAGVWTVTGTQNYAVVNAAMMLIALACLAANYILFHLHGGRALAVLMTVLLALCHNLYHHSFMILADVPFFLGLLLFLVGYEWMRRTADAHPRRRIIGSCAVMLAGVCIMAAFRSVVVTFLAGLAMTVLWRLIVSPHRVRYAIVLGVALLGFFIFRMIDPRLSRPGELTPDEAMVRWSLLDEFGFTVGRAFRVTIPDLLTESTAEALTGVDLGPIASVPVTLAIAASTVFLFRRRALWGLLVVAFVGQFAVHVVAVRYFIAIAPLLLFAWWRLIEWTEEKTPPQWARPVAIGLLILVTVPNFVRIMGTIIEQHHPRFLEVYRGGLFAGLPEFGSQVEAAIRQYDLVVVDAEEIRMPLSYFSHRQVIGPEDVPGLPPGSRVHFAQRTSAGQWELTHMIQIPLVTAPSNRLGQKASSDKSETSDY